MKLLQELFWRWCHYCSIDSKPEIAFIELQSFKRFQAKINSTMQTKQTRSTLEEKLSDLHLSIKMFAHQVNLRGEQS